jgi:hypothetical protein
MKRELNEFWANHPDTEAQSASELREEALIWSRGGCMGTAEVLAGWAQIYDDAEKKRNG